MIEYLSRIFGECISSKEYVFPGSAPFYIVNGYKTEKLVLHNLECVLATPTDADARLPVLKKHFEKICEITGLPCALNLEKLTLSQRENLISSNIPFVSEKQVYLPFWGSVFTARMSAPVELAYNMTPTTQLVFLYVFYRLMAGNGSINATAISANVNIPKSSAAKAVKDLTAMGLFITQMDGTNKWISLNGSFSEVIQKSIHLMCSPIKNELWLKSIPNNVPFMLGGIRGLAENSMLASNERDGAIVFNKEDANLLSKDMLIAKRDFDDFGGVAAEVWKYSPELLTEGKVVDDISLYLCLKDAEDERIQKELDRIRNKYGIELEED